MGQTYDQGDLVRFTATFVASGGVTSDPSYVWHLNINGTGVRATHRYGLTPSAIVRAGTGAYYIDVDITIPGNWSYRWEGSGGLQAAVEDNFNVRPTFHL